MKKYKLLKDLPDHTIGDIESEEHWTKWFKNHNFSNQLDNKEWFKELKIKYFTEEDDPIYEDEKSYFICLGNKDEKIENLFNEWRGNAKSKKAKYFSSKRNAQAYKNKLIWENKLKFKIGDRIVNKNINTLYFTILKHDFLNELYVVQQKDSDKKDAIFFKDQDNFKPYDIRYTFGFLGTRSHLEAIFEEEIDEEQEDSNSLKPKFEIGKWYEHNGSIMCYQGNNKDYGFCNNIWIKGGWILHNDWKLAGKEKVKKLLLEKAKKEYPVGTKIKLMKYDRVDDIATIEFNVYSYYEGKEGCIICEQKKVLKNNSRDFYIYNNGEWAEIIEKPLYQNSDGTFIYKSDFKEKKFFTIADPDFKIGDKVKVISEDLQYPSYKEAFEELGFKKSSYDYNTINGDIGYIFNITKHHSRNKILIAIKLLNGNEVLIDKEGIAKFKLVSDDNTSLFIGDSFYCVGKNTLEFKYWKDDFTKTIKNEFVVNKDTFVKDPFDKIFSTLENANKFIAKEKAKKLGYEIGDRIWNVVTKKYRGEIISLYLDKSGNLLCDTDIQTSVLLEEDSFITNITNKAAIITYDEEEYRYACKILNRKFFPKPENRDFKPISLSINTEYVNSINYFKRKYILLTIEEYYQSLK